MPYRQTWTLLGYARGALLKSISLAPQEEMTIEVFTWDRHKRQVEESLTTEQEKSAETTLTHRDTLETVRDAVEHSGWKLSAHADVTIPSTPVKVGASGENKDELDLTNKTTHTVVAEAVEKASTRIKATRQTKIEESVEFGSEQRVTRKLKNPNMCRTLTFDYYEVVSGYSVSTALRRERIRLCVLVPNLIPGGVDRGFLLCHEGVLRDALRNKAYLGGFDAARMLAAAERLCTFKCRAACTCSSLSGGAASPSGSGAPPIGGPGSGGPIDRGTGIPGLSPWSGALRMAVAGTDPMAGVAAAATDLINCVNGLDKAKPDDYCSLSWDADDTARDKARAAFGSWRFWLIVQKMDPSNWSRLRAFAQANRTDAAALDGVMSQVDFTRIETSDPVFKGLEEVGDELTQLGAACSVRYSFDLFKPPLNDNGLGGSLANANAALAAYQAATTPASGTSTSSNGSAAPKQDEYSAKDLAEASIAEDQLLCHVREDESYYRGEIWRHVSADDQLRFLQHLGSIDQIVDNQVLGFVGENAAMPVLIDRKDLSPLNAWFETVVSGDDANPPEPLELVLPTPGVETQTRLGDCDACEHFILEHRRLDLEQKVAEVAAARAHAGQEASEAERYKKRLAQTPPNLDAPSPCCEGQTSLRVVLDKPPTV